MRIGGHDIMAEAVEAKRRLAFFPDEPRLFDYMTVEEHLEFAAAIYGVAEWRAPMNALLDEFELGGLSVARSPSTWRPWSCCS